MISFENFIMEDGSPIYQQILRYIKRGVIAGSIKDGDELPSRRVLSAMLGVNPNTVQKAYRMLEEEELICSHSGAKSYMLLGEDKVRLIRAEMLENDTMNAIRMLRQMGVSREEAVALIEELWDRSEES
ncbi:MAG: GntR family transcriptional regulator [Clostridiales bacterium]|nr:GntR family transcriptional regulator [Clostridiales bacterium]